MREIPAISVEVVSALIVCDDEDTLNHLRDYLTRAGVRARGTRRLDDAWPRRFCETVVLLPDDFKTVDATDGLSRLLARTPSARIIIVTAAPRLYEPLIESWGSPESVVTMPKPVWGWTIVDLLRDWSSAPA